MEKIEIKTLDDIREYIIKDAILEMGKDFFCMAEEEIMWYLESLIEEEIVIRGVDPCAKIKYQVYEVECLADKILETLENK